MAVAYSILGQACPANTTAAALFSLTGGHSYVISSLVVSNVTSSAATCRVYAQKAGAAVATTNAILYDVSIPGNSTATFTLGITLSAANSDAISIATGTANSLTFTAFGSDIS